MMEMRFLGIYQAENNVKGIFQRTEGRHCESETTVGSESPKQSVDERFRRVDKHRSKLRPDRLPHCVPPLSLRYCVRNDGNPTPCAAPTPIFNTN